MVFVTNTAGLLTRDSAAFSQTAGRYHSSIQVEYGDKIVNAKSMLGVLSLDIQRGTRVNLIAEGEDEEKAVEDLASILTS